MPLIYKIFLFLFLQQGTKDVSVPGSSKSGNWETLLLARPMTLRIQSDEQSIDEVLSICALQRIACEVKKENMEEGRVKADIIFQNLAYTEKDKMMRHITACMNRVQLQWIEL